MGEFFDFEGRFVGISIYSELGLGVRSYFWFFVWVSGWMWMVVIVVEMRGGGGLFLVEELEVSIYL